MIRVFCFLKEKLCTLEEPLAEWEFPNFTHKTLQVVLTRAVVPIQGDFLPWRDLPVSGDILGRHNLGRGCSWHLGDGGQGCAPTSYSAQDSPLQETSAGLQMPTALKAKTPGLGRELHEGRGHARLTHHCIVSNLSSARNSKCLVLFIHENWTLTLQSANQLVRPHLAHW